MRATAERLEKSTVLLEVEVEAERFNKAVEHAYRRLVKDLVIPGFRKGRIPRVILERYMGKERLYEEAATLVMGEVFPEAVKDAGIEPVSKPEVEIVQAEEGKPMVFKAKVEVKPEVELGQYKGIEVQRQVKEVTPEDVEAELDNLRNRYARLTTVDEGNVTRGDIVKVDYQGIVDGQPFTDGIVKGKEIEVGFGYLLPEVDEGIVGMSPGETKEIKVTFPPDHQNETLAGKEATVTITVREIRRKELMPLGDDFAKEVSEFDTLEELKADLENRLRQAAAAEADIAVRQEVVDKAVENATVEIPASMVNDQVEEMMEDMKTTAEGRGVTQDRLFEILKATPEEMRERMRKDAERNIKTRLVLDAVAKVEGLAAGVEEIEDEVKKIAGIYRQEPEELRKALEESGRIGIIEQKLLRDKAIQFLVDNAIIKEESQSPEALQEEDGVPEEPAEAAPGEKNDTPEADSEVTPAKKRKRKS
ncbi:MAG: trigger factor [Bacillota bacterium]